MYFTFLTFYFSSLGWRLGLQSMQSGKIELNNNLHMEHIKKSTPRGVDTLYTKTKIKMCRMFRNTRNMYMYSPI